MKFEKLNFKELYVSKYGSELDWDKLNEFAKYVCDKQKNEIIDTYKKHSTSLDGTTYINIDFINSIN